MHTGPLVLLALLARQSAPQDEPRAGEGVPERTIVTATRVEASLLETPYTDTVISEERIRELDPRSTPQILRVVPGVMVQETAFGQGSPYIRGFTGFRNLFLIDGIRLNNSVFREGPNQYWSTVDPLSIERLEVVKGPTSVLYGSDAIGGTVNALTRTPYRVEGGGPGGRPYAGELFYRVSSAENSHIGRGEASYVTPLADGSLGVLLGGGGKTFGEVRGGEDTGHQPNTGYDEWDGDLKVERWIGATRLTGAYQLVGQNNVPRTHSTIFARSFHGTTVGTDLKRDLDQDRRLAWVGLENRELDGFFDRANVTLSWHTQSEVQDRIRSSLARSKQGFDVGTLGLVAAVGAPTDLGRFTFGLDYYRDHVDSFQTGQPIQGPVADEALYTLGGLFVQDEIPLAERTELVLGLRGNHAAVDADSVLDPSTSSRTTLDEDWSSLVGSVRVLQRLIEDELSVFAGVSQGFRAPNLSDLTRLDSARSNEFEIPSTDLDPEHTLHYEVGLESRSERLETQSAVFYTDIDDLIVRVPTGNVLPTGEVEVTKENASEGWVFGFESSAAYEFSPEWTVFASAAWLEGKVDAFPGPSPASEEEYIDRLMPLQAGLGLGWREDEGGRWAELELAWADDAEKLSSADELDTQRIPPGGTPSYLLVHLRGGVPLGRHATLDVALENLTNEDYRVHGSGSNGPGRNLVVGLTYAP
jgi:hemoglobin/transferrin/lactoferrin receptor protein